MPLHELFVDVGIGVGGAVGRDQQLCAVKVGRIHRHKLDLAGPLTQLRLHRSGSSLGLGSLPAELLHGAARAAVEGRCRRLCGRGSLFLFVFQHGLFIVSSGFPLGEGNGAGGAAGQAVAEAVAVVVPHQLCLAIHQPDGSLVAGGDAGPAAVALFFVYVNDFTDHGKSPPCFDALSIL